MVKFGDMVLGTKEACRKWGKSADGVMGVVIKAEEDRYIIVFEDTTDVYFADREDFVVINSSCPVIDCPYMDKLKGKEY